MALLSRKPEGVADGDGSAHAHGRVQTDLHGPDESLPASISRDGATKENETVTRLLVIEDNPDDRRLYREALEASADATFVETGASGLEHLRADPDGERPELVFLDLDLPDVSGFDVLERRAEDPALRAVPTVVVSGSTRPVDVDRAYDLGANAYLVKPMDPGEFITMVRRARAFWTTHGDET